MRRLFVAGLLAGLSHVFMAQPVQAFEQIDLFNSDITIQSDTSLAITEVITYQTDETKHGIYRYLPYRYARNGLNYTTRIDIQSVTDDRGQAIPYEQTRDRQFVTLKIGDADKTFTGQQKYVISYEVQEVLHRYDEHDELYWDITGEGWQVPVAASIATIHSPVAPITRAVCYAGPVGSDDGECQVVNQTENLVAVAYANTIDYGDNMTLVVALSKNNQLVFPTPTQELWAKIRENLSLLVFVVAPLIFGWWWWRHGRDRLYASPNVFSADDAAPQTLAPLLGNRRIPFVYEPLKELSPGEAGVMMDEQADNQDVVAEIIELAHKKFIKIERTEKKKFLSSETDYVLTKLKATSQGLPVVQAYLFDHFFADGDKSVKLSSLKGSFYQHMTKAKSLLMDSLTDKKLFAGNPSVVRGVGMGFAIAAVVVMRIVMFISLEQGQWVALPLMVMAAPLTFLFAWSLPAKTARGSNLAMQAKGLRQTIAYGKWREEIKEKRLFIEAVLPFAIALGVVDKLARDMADLNLEPPRYLQGPGLGQSLAFHSFMHEFGSQASSTLAYNPASSSTSGGSGFSGGSSGGGGGVGGGGSW